VLKFKKKVRRQKVNNNNCMPESNTKTEESRFGVIKNKRGGEYLDLRERRTDGWRKLHRY
jgi:hypothetical protein